MASRHDKGGRKTGVTRRRLWLGTVSVLMLLTSAGIALGAWLSQPGKLPIKRVQVSGEFRHLSQEAIAAKVLDSIDGGFFDVDMERLRGVVLDMPWVEEVSVRRVWPDLLRMSVTEQVPTARWHDDSLVNVRGQVFKPGDISGTEGLVVLKGPRNAAPRLVAFHRDMQSRLGHTGLHIDQIRLDDRREWSVRFANGLVLALGKEMLGSRLTDFATLYTRLNAEGGRRPASIDMRYQHGFAVRWHAPVSDTPGGDS